MADNTHLPKTRLRRLNIRLTDKEWDKIHALSAATTCRSISEYARKVLSQKPVKVFYRNQSFDNFEEHMTHLLPCLDSFTQYFALLTEKLLSLDNIPEIRASVAPLLACGRNVEKATLEIRTHLEKLSDYATQNNPLAQPPQNPDL